MIVSATDDSVYDIRNRATRKFIHALADRVDESHYESHVISKTDNFWSYKDHGLDTLAENFLSYDRRSMFALYRMTMNDTESFVQSRYHSLTNSFVIDVA